jgi:hypothetical protein
MLPLVAITFAPPLLTPVTSPVLLTVATLAELDVQVTVELQFAVELSE